MKFFKLCFAFLISLPLFGSEKKDVNVMMVAGGCCHEYEVQMELLEGAFKESFNCKVDAFVEGKSRTHLHSKLKEKNWSKGYDAVLMSMCYGHVKDDDYILSIIDEVTKEKKGIVFLHCSLHNFRSTEKGTDRWRKLLGLTSKGHEKKGDELVENTNPTHPIMKEFPKSYTFPEEEVYIITEVQPNTVELARAYGPKTKKYHPVAWVHQDTPNKVFGFSVGHSTITYSDKVFTDLVARGLLWTVDGIDPEGKVLPAFKRDE